MLGLICPFTLPRSGFLDLSRSYELVVVRLRIQAIRIEPHAAIIHNVEHDKCTPCTGVPESSRMAHVDLPYAPILVHAEVVRVSANIGGDSVIHQGLPGLPKTVAVCFLNIQGIILVAQPSALLIWLGKSGFMTNHELDWFACIG